MSGKRVLSVGQCFADHSHIARTFEQAFAAEVVGVDTTLEALEKLRAESFDLVLVNRVYDADGSPGLELIRQVKGDEDLKQTPVMLVSNYDDAQREAVAAGAEPGFGKASLGAPQMINRVKGVLGTPA
jgi:PleD family two-component response regulator